MHEQLVTAGETWKDQLDIDKLLKQPRRSHKDQIYPVNNKYGFGRSLKIYTGIPDTESIRGIIPHGAGGYGDLNTHPEAPKQELHSKIPCIFTSSERCYKAFWNAGKRHLFPIGLASIYTHECIKSEKRQGQGSLFFRSHSTPAIVDRMSDAEAIEWLKSLPKRFHPINISVFPFDYKRGIYKPYEEAGFRLVCAGSEYDEGFIWRHLHLIKSHRFILSTGMGTHIFHSSLCGKPAIIKRLAENYRTNHPDFIRILPKNKAFLDLANIFLEERDEPSQRQINLSSEFLGTQNLASPETLARFLDLAKRIHQDSQR